jgi:hypothetical protein
MGAWGYGNFDNDSALDWVIELERDDTLNTVETALMAITATEEYLDADECCFALAAAEVVAALVGKPAADLPNEVTNWVSAHQALDARPLLDTARRAVQAVLTSEDSELRELAMEADDPAEWEAAVNDLQQRLMT